MIVVYRWLRGPHLPARLSARQVEGPIAEFWLVGRPPECDAVDGCARVVQVLDPLRRSPLDQSAAAGDRLSPLGGVPKAFVNSGVGSLVQSEVVVASDEELAPVRLPSEPGEESLELFRSAIHTGRGGGEGSGGMGGVGMDCTSKLTNREVNAG